MPALQDKLKTEARAVGFDLVGIAPATAADGFARFEAWLEAGHAGEMAYLQRHVGARRHPASIQTDVRSVVMVGMNYKPRQTAVAPLTQPSPPWGGGGVRGSRAGGISCYAQGRDYHDVLRERLRRLLEWVQREVPECRGRIVVDTAPLLERDFARRAGLGWFGKNTMLLNKRLGSYFFLGGLLLNIELQADSAHETSHCGTCRACLDACPTQAFRGPAELDARRCISYLTIELRGSIPEELREPMGEWVFGCDVCQEVCPWNRKAPEGAIDELQARPELRDLDPCEVLQMSAPTFRQRFRGTALTRPRRAGLLRNAAIALGNRGDPATLPVLRQALTDAEPLVREAAHWAIGRIAAKCS